MSERGLQGRSALQVITPLYDLGTGSELVPLKTNPFCSLLASTAQNNKVLLLPRRNTKITSEILYINIIMFIKRIIKFRFVYQFCRYVDRVA